MLVIMNSATKYYNRKNAKKKTGQVPGVLRFLLGLGPGLELSVVLGSQPPHVDDLLDIGIEEVG